MPSLLLLVKQEKSGTVAFIYGNRLEGKTQSIAAKYFSKINSFRAITQNSFSDADTAGHCPGASGPSW